MLDWDAFRVVLAVARGGTLTAAASALGVDRTTAGRQLRRAESALGTPAFHRTPEGLALTPAGRELVEAARRAEAELLAGEVRALAADPSLQGPLRVSVMDMIFEAFAPVFASFVDLHPGVALTVSTSEVYVSLARREAEVAIRLGNAPGDHLVGRKLRRVEFGLYAARSLAQRIGEGAPLADFPWLAWDLRQSEDVIAAWREAHAPGARIAMRCDSVAVARRSVRAGIGVMFLPALLADADPQLQSLEARLEGQGRDLWLLTLPELRATPRVRAFMDHAAREIVAS